MKILLLLTLVMSFGLVSAYGTPCVVQNGYLTDDYAWTTLKMVAVQNGVEMAEAVADGTGFYSLEIPNNGQWFLKPKFTGSPYSGVWDHPSISVLVSGFCSGGTSPFSIDAHYTARECSFQATGTVAEFWPSTGFDYDNSNGALALVTNVFDSNGDLVSNYDAYINPSTGAYTASNGGSVCGRVELVPEIRVRQKPGSWTGPISFTVDQWYEWQQNVDFYFYNN